MDQPNPPQPQLMNWSYVKPEFSGKAEEDATTHLLKTNNWMDTCNFPEDIKKCYIYVTQPRLSPVFLLRRQKDHLKYKASTASLQQLITVSTSKNGQ